MRFRILNLCAGALMLASLFLSPCAWGQSAAVPAAVPCNGPAGARFNLEPRANAAAQNEPTTDFLYSRVAPNDDLVVQVANDFRGNISTANWDASPSGYYVHRSTTADCSVQFEGGLPLITSSGTTYTSFGNPVVAADPARDAFFAADTRAGATALQTAIGVFRASAANLLNPAKCPAGTHTAAQAASCWEATPPALVLPNSAGFPQLAVDERATGAGKGAGDVYVVSETTAITLTACTNSLSKCSSIVSIDNLSGGAIGFEFLHVRSDGVITISYPKNITVSGSTTEEIAFVSCTPTGAPNPPICGTPTVVRQVPSPINSGFSVLFPLTNIQMLTFTYPKHTTRAEAGGKFTTFLVYDDCKNSFTFQKPPVSICVDSEVVLVTSTDNGKTWSAPVSVDTATGHHFFPAIGTDTSTGIINLAYYSTEGDPFNHEVRVMRNQIVPGSTSPGTPKTVTTVQTAIDLAPQRINQSQNDFFMGIVARGNSATGISHLYTSFDSTAVTGNYNGRALPELNNHISMITY